MEKKVLLAITLSFLVLAGYQYVVVRPAAIRQAAAKAAAQQAAAAAPAPAAPVQAGAPATVGQPAAPAASAVPAAPQVEALVADARERDIVVENDHIRAVFSTRGVVLTHWELKKYLDGGGSPIDVIPPQKPGSAEAGFAIATDDAALTSRIGGALFKPSADGLTVGASGGSVAFEFRDAGGLTVRKRFDFGKSASPYVVNATIEATLNGAAVPFTVWSGPGLGEVERATTGTFLSPSYYQAPEGIVHKDGKVARLSASTLGTEALQQGAIRYAGADDHYFLMAILPAEGATTRLDYKTVAFETPQGPRALVAFRMLLDRPWNDVRFFLGPKQFDDLVKVDREMVRAINFGMFDFLVVPLLRSLNWIHGFIGNYGWSIIALTVLINLIMWPLRHKSMVSMRKMQEIQPIVKSIQDRYAHLKMTDPGKQKMNEEMMRLYKEKGVNPASGCVPMLLTFPVLFAFYAMLSQAIELRGAPFAGWIHDLSVKDPLFITPILMGITMLWQQKMTPSSMDPAQAKIMMFMPVMFTFMFLWAPSGLVIYWFCSNLFAIGQQYMTNHLIGPPPGATARPMATKA